MRVRPHSAALAALSVAALWGSSARAREISFEERLAAESAIARVYHAHQIGDRRPFEEAVPRAVLERRVRAYLARSAALETVWRVPITPAALRDEVERIARTTRLPERLDEIYRALGDDPFLVQECLARPALVARLARERFAFDREIHAGERREAEAMRERLLRGPIEPGAHDGRLRTSEIVRAGAATSPRGDDSLSAAAGGRSIRVEFDDREFARSRERAPERVGEIGPVVEEEDAFVVRAVLSERPDSARIAAWVVPKKRWDAWADEVFPSLESTAVPAVAAELVPLPRARASDTARFPAYAPITCTPTNGWDSGALDSVPDGRDDAAVVWTGSVAIVWGGYHGGRVASGGRYDPLTDSWSPVSYLNAPPPLEGFTAVWTGSALLVWGGARCCDGSGFDFWTSDGYRYDPSTDTWTAIASAGAPVGRQNHVAVWTGQRMLVWGGRFGDLTGNQYPTAGGRYDPATDSWSPMSAAGAPTGREQGAAVWTGTEMLVWGGTTTDFVTTEFLATGGRYDPQSDAWSATTVTGAPQGRANHTAVWSGRWMIVWGGAIVEQTGTRTLGSGGRYDPATDSWLPTAAAGAPPSRIEHSAVWADNLMIVWGGYHREPIDGVQYYGTGARYDPEADTWTPIATTGAPSARDRHVGIWTGTRMIVWGGSAPGAYFETGGRYDPNLDAWAPTFWPGAPAGRTNATAVWTGNVMIVWGGLADAEPLATGGRYDPLTDSWSPTTLTGAPLGRVYHTAVWSGSEMIVWGGEPPHFPLEFNRGGRYDPLSDGWTYVNYLTAPAIRARHVAVWTGSRMVVWGGESLDFPRAPLDTGSRYDPATDTWSATATSQAPAARTAPAAVWTGSRMVVWGGSDLGANTNYFNSGGRYDPVANAWSSVSKAGAPAGRRSHTAVWSGSKMIVWGGNNGADLNTGGRYDPAGDGWLAMSTTNAPTPRIGHAAVWAESAMVVWGGEPSATGVDALATGGRYDPMSNTWLPVASSGAPEARRDHVAVWTGDFVLVWGGSDRHDLASGGRYVVTNPDADSDGRADVCDCSPGDPSLLAVPGEVAGVRFGGDDANLWWDSALPSGGSATIHDVVKGPLGGAGICLASGVAANNIADASTPAPGTGIWYLVRGRNSCGTGSYGTSSDGTPRVLAVCP